MFIYTNSEVVSRSLDGLHVPVDDGEPEVGIVVSELVRELSVETVVQQDDFCFSRGFLLNQNISYKIVSKICLFYLVGIPGCGSQWT